MSGLNLYNFFVTKPYVWAMTHLFGHSDEDQATAEIEQYEPLVKTELASLFGSEVAGIVTGSDVTLATVQAAVAPKAEAFITSAIAKVGVPALVTNQVTAWATALVPDIIGAAYADAVAAVTP